MDKCYAKTFIYHHIYTDIPNPNITGDFIHKKDTMQGANNCSTKKGKREKKTHPNKKTHQKANTEMSLGSVTVHTGKGGTEGRNESSGSDS